MVTSVEESRQFVEEVVEALTATSADQPGSGGDFRNQFQRAAVEFDERTAKAFGKALVDALCDDPSNVRMLEALLILGLAHPTVVKRYGVSLSQEGRRLSVLLEQAGEEERARSLLETLVTSIPGDRSIEQELGRHMRRNGETDELIERCLRQAETLAAQGRPQDAIPWLQEVLLHDRNRRDVARMIRDLRYQELEQHVRRRRRRFVGLTCLLLSAVIAGLYVRETQLAERYVQLPPAVPGDLASHQTRLNQLEDFAAETRVWLGMFSSASERSILRQEVDRLAALAAQMRREQREKAEQHRIQAVALRERGLSAVEQGDLESALADFQQALELAPNEWEHRPRLLADVEAITEWLERPLR